MPPLLKTILLSLIIILSLNNCSGGGGGGGIVAALGIDIVVVDGYIRDANVVDSNSNKAKYKSNGTYTFTPAPTGEITVSGGFFEDTGLPNTMTYKVSSSSRVISPITSFLYKYPHLKQKILTALGINSIELLGDFVKSNSVDVAKLAQLMYVMNINNLEDDFANTLTNDTDPVDIDDIFTKAKARVTANNPTKATQIQNFLDVVKAYAGNASGFEVAIQTEKENTYGNVTQSYSVTTSSNIGGIISPTSINVNSGESTSFTITSDINYIIGSVTGCAGSLNGSVYTTGVINSDCSVNVVFIRSNNPPILSNASPTNTLASGTTSTIISLTTNKNATCKYSTVPNTSYSTILNTFTITGSTTHSENLNGLTDATSYIYYVRCSDAFGNETTIDYEISFSVDSAVVSDTQAPSIPNNITATALSSSKINLSWNTSTDNVGVIGYKIYRDGLEIATTVNNSYSDTGLTAERTYFYTVSAYDIAGNNSNQSSQAQATTFELTAKICGTQTGTVVSIPFNYVTPVNVGKYITFSATSELVTTNIHDTVDAPNINWSLRYKDYKYGNGGGAINEWKLNSVPSNGVLYEKTTALNAGDIVSDPDDLFYVPKNDYSGIDSFTYCASDTTGQSNIATINIQVAKTNQYPMPYGIPNPEFGIDEQLPIDPPEWPNAQRVGFYYIDSDNNQCSDANNDYGYPNLPRCSIPASGASIVAGGKMVLAPSIQPYPLRNSSWQQINFEGTIENPSWLIGNDTGPIKPIITLNLARADSGTALRITGGYLQISGIIFDGPNLDHRGGGADEVVIRHSEFKNYPSTGGGGTTVGLSTGGSGVLVFNVYAHDNGIVESDGLSKERDIHAFVGLNQVGYWILDSRCDENAGDCVQLTNNNTTENFYVGRLVAHSDGENCVDIKDFNRVVVSESDCWDLRQVKYGNSGGNAQNFYVNDEGLQQNYVYFLNNRSWDTGGSNYSSANIGGRVYFIGNVSFASPDGYGFYSGGGDGSRYVYFNTFVNSKIGIFHYGTGLALDRYIVGNIVDGASLYQTRLMGATSIIDMLDYNFYTDFGNFASGGNSEVVHNDLAAFKAAKGFEQNSAEGISTNYVNKSIYDFKITAISDARDKISSNDVSSLPFLTDLFNDLSITNLKDYAKTTRPQDLIWDIGAYEYNKSNTVGYSPPLGIPAPDFGIDEKISDYYTRPSPWNQETSGWYYINQYDANASDSYNYGTPDNPRQTIPDPIPAGSVVEIHGIYDFAPTGYDLITTNGTKEAPVFIVGNNQSIVKRKWVFKAAYTIIQNLEFTENGKVTIVYPSHHIAIRDNEHHHIAGKIGGYGNAEQERIHNIVIYNNKIHSQDGWNQNPDIDLDNHGIKFGRFSEDIWILDNLAYNNGGNFIQVGDWNNPANNELARRYYIGRNISYANRQSSIGVKQSSDVIISENHLYNNHAIQTNAAGQSGIVFQYGPERLWILNNHIHNSNAGITAGSNSGGTGQEQYIVGNKIYDIHTAVNYVYNVNTSWSPAAIQLSGGVNRHIINNTIYDVDAGINCPSGGSLNIRGNIIYNVSKANHIFIENETTSQASKVYNNIFYQDNDNVKIRWENNSAINTITFESQFSTLSGNNLEVNPLFVNIGINNFNLQSSSPAIDAGIESNVYQIFNDLYSLDIKKDQNNIDRPQNSDWDIGSYEY